MRAAEEAPQIVPRYVRIIANGVGLSRSIEVDRSRSGERWCPLAKALGEVFVKQDRLSRNS